MTITRKPKLSRCPRERAFLHKWLLRKGIKYLNRMKNVPEVVLIEYETDLSKHSYVFPKYFISEERLKVIEQYIDYTLEIHPAYRKLLKITGMNSKDMGYFIRV